jgi:hypothetical protein
VEILTGVAEVLITIPMPLEVSPLNSRISLSAFMGRVPRCLILCGIETDLDSLILHGEDGRVADLAEIQEGLIGIELARFLRSFYPSMPQRNFRDLITQVEGNIRHARITCDSNRPTEEAENTKSGSWE